MTKVTTNINNWQHVSVKGR